MKKILSMCLALLFLLSFSACSSRVSPSEVDRMIQDYPNVGYEALLRDYDQLTEAEQKGLKHYSRMQEIIKAEEEWREFSSIESSARREIEHYIKRDLRNPESLQVHDSGVCNWPIYRDGNIFYVSAYIDYSAQNGLGGYERERESLRIMAEIEKKEETVRTTTRVLSESEYDSAVRNLSPYEINNPKKIFDK